MTHGRIYVVHLQTRTHGHTDTRMPVRGTRYRKCGSTRPKMDDSATPGPAAPKAPRGVRVPEPKQPHLPHVEPSMASVRPRGAQTNHRHQLGYHSITPASGIRNSGCPQTWPQNKLVR
ncbi:hypothetical protein BKA56DRAFT_353577 [Ilyonectria sp. MPI-CAGE-AT-0026]|nr:hypothetical protein BKA56DRAFT_353577 [Ilyonectria sp. MPI-CAGE-AT-0026]